MPTARTPSSMAKMHRPVRRERSAQGCERRRLNPLGGEPVEMWTTLPRCPQSHEAEQEQKKRTYDVLPKPDKLIRYRQTIWSTMAQVAASACDRALDCRDCLRLRDFSCANDAAVDGRNAPIAAVRGRRGERVQSTRSTRSSPRVTGRRLAENRTRQGKLRGLEFERREPDVLELLPSLGGGQETRRDRQALRADDSRDGVVAQFANPSRRPRL
jgi:hypothetical protein